MRHATLQQLSRACPFMACAVILPIGVPAMAGAPTNLPMQGADRSRTIHVLVNGDPVPFAGVGPRVIDGRMMVPLRGVTERSSA